MDTFVDFLAFAITSDTCSIAPNHGRNVWKRMLRLQLFAHERRSWKTGGYLSFSFALRAKCHLSSFCEHCQLLSVRFPAFGGATGGQIGVKKGALRSLRTYRAAKLRSDSINSHHQFHLPPLRKPPPPIIIPLHREPRLDARQLHVLSSTTSHGGSITLNR